MLVEAKIKTNQKKFNILKKNNKWVIYVKSSPECGKANIEIIKALLKQYRNVRIVSGLKNKNKLIEIS